MMNGWTMGGWMWIWPVLVLLGLAVLVYAVTRLSGSRQASSVLGNESAPASSARQILDERYARGEIDEDDYHKRRGTLQ